MRPNPSHDAPMASEILSPAEVAAYLQVSYITVIRLLLGGKLPGRKVGGSWRTRRRDLDRLFDDQSPYHGG